MKTLSNKSKRIINAYLNDMISGAVYNWIINKKVLKTENELKDWLIQMLNSNTNRFSKSKIELCYKTYTNTNNKTFFKLKVIVDDNRFIKQIRIYDNIEYEEKILPIQLGKQEILGTLRYPKLIKDNGQPFDIELKLAPIEAPKNGYITLLNPRPEKLKTMLNIFTFDFGKNGSEWIYAETLIKAIRVYCETQDVEITEFEDKLIDITELEYHFWEDYFVINDDFPKVSFLEWTKENKHEDYICGTMYDSDLY